MIRTFAALILLLSASVSAQVVTGTPPFGSYAGGQVDTINLANLNVHVDIPVVAKPGRGMPFSYRINYDNSIWYPIWVNGVKVWAPVSNFGWRGTTEAAVGYLTYRSKQVKCWEDGDWWMMTFDYNYVYHDGGGTSHSFLSTEGNCQNGGDFDPNATDQSGFYLAGTGVYTRSGVLITAPVNTYTGSGSLTDPNGNTIYTSNGTSFIDTLGYNALTVSGSPSSGTVHYQYPGQSGTLDTYITYEYKTVQTQFLCSGIGDYGPLGNWLATRITLPDGSYYQIDYEQTPNIPANTTGRISSIRLPTGGKITYTYTGANDGINCSDGSTLAMTRSTYTSATTLEGSTQYTREAPVAPDTAWKTTIVDAANNDSILTFQGNYEVQRLIYSGHDTGRTLKQTLDTCYNSTIPDADGKCLGAVSTPISQIKSYRRVPDRSGITALVAAAYDSIGRVVETDEYDWNSLTTPVRKTATEYASIGNIRDRPSRVTVKSGGDALAAKTEYTYDAQNHGNVTGIRRYADNSTSLLQQFSYNNDGTVATSTDVNGTVTTFGYGGASCGAFPTSTSTLVNASVTLTRAAEWNCAGGVQTSSTDENSQTTSYSYDGLWRLTTVSYPDGGQTTTSVNEDPNSHIWYIVQSQKVDATKTVYMQSNLDGLGRVNWTWRHDAAQTDNVYTNRGYNSRGQLSWATNPYRTANDPTYGYVEYQYDALGHTTRATTSDTNYTTVEYDSNTQTVTDPTGRKRKYLYDALGRLATVLEPDASGNLTVQTNYSYDLLNNLHTVDQQGQGRTFNYDWLSRLTSETNPETGAVSYNYDANGDLQTRTDARSITTTFSYDALHRLIYKSYSANAGTPNVGFEYDQSSLWGNSLLYGKGRLTHMYVSTSEQSLRTETIYIHDQMGRVLHQGQCFPSNCGTGGNGVYTWYDLAGNPTQMQYPSGRVVTYGYNSTDQLNRVTFAQFGGSQVNYDYLSSVSYTPTGAPSSVSFGNGVVETLGYNSRLQPSTNTVSKGGSQWSSLTYSFYNASQKNNGTVQSITDVLNSARNQTFGYDQLNRINSNNEGRWGLTFGYDSRGNFLHQTLTQGWAPSWDQSSTANNRIDGLTYDATGNVTWDGSHGYQWDAESRMKSVDTTLATYIYAADGARVRKEVGGNWTEYIYFGGQVIAEHLSNGQWSDYIYAGGRRIAKEDVATVVVRFTNDSASGGGDRNLFVNSITIGSNTIYPSDPSVSYTAAPCNRTEGGVGYILCNGDMIASTSAAGQTISVNAYGTPDYNVYPHMEVWVNGVLLGVWDVTGTAQTYTVYNKYTVRFNNDWADGTGDRNLFVNSTTVGSTTFYANNPGVAFTAAPCNYASGTTGVIQCNGDMTTTTPTTGSSVSVSAYGTASEQVYPHMQLLMNGILLGEWDVTGSSQNYTADVSGRKLYYYHSDHLGSSRLLTDASGNVVWQGTFLPYGYEYSPQGSVTNYKFTGFERDSESGLDHAWFRQYAPHMGRWMSPDPAGLAAVDPTNPQTWNRYAYVMNNPMNLVDPNGDCAQIVITVTPSGSSMTQDFSGCVGRGAGNGGAPPHLPELPVDSEGGGSGDSGGVAANNFTLGLRQPGQTFNQCMQANAGNYSLLGVADFATGANGQIADNFWLGFTPASNTVTNVYNAAAGSLTSLLQAGPTIVTAGTGTNVVTGASGVVTSGRRTSSIMSLNLSGTPGGPKGGFPALGPAPSNAARAAKAAAGLLKLAIDTGFFLAEAAGCAGPMNP